jgi:hypothetical protein
MRTTLDIDDDVLQAAKELASRHKATTGKMLSELARKGLFHRDAEFENGGTDDFLGFVPFPHRGGVITNELINTLRAAEDRE